jgi:hypothetical protein
MERDFDSFFKEVVRERMEEMPCPPKEETWERIKTRLRAERKMERRRYWKRCMRPVIAACVTIVVLVVLYTNYQSPVLAYAGKFVKTLIEITDDTIRIHKKVVPIEDKDKEDYFFGRNIEDPRIGEAQKKVHFMLLIPEYLPDGFSLSNVNVLNKYEKMETVTMLYNKETENGGKISFEITQDRFPDESSATYTMQKKDDMEIEHIEINGSDCILIEEESGCALFWSEENISREITGSIGREEIIRIAESMK